MSNLKEGPSGQKTPLHLIPARPLEGVAWAMANGADKYGAFNWRDGGVKASTYYAATLRHLMAWYEGEDLDPDSGERHLSHAIASLLVLADGPLIDDRPRSGGG